MIDLAAETDRLLDFAERSRHPEGGFAWLRADGTPDLERPRELWITTRMTHVFALGVLLGRPGAAELVEHGLASLRDDFRDARYGGWYAQVGGSTDKRAYEHVFVVLAAASAGDAELLGEALEVLETHFWDERAGALVDVYNRDWSELEPYRGANANMHGVEAMLATEDPLWRERAARVTQRLVVDNHPMLNEHFDAEWRPLPDYNVDDPGIRSGRTARRSGTGSNGRGWPSRWAASRPTRGACSRPGCRTAGTAAGSSTRSTGTASRSSATTCTGSCARRSPRPPCSARTRCRPSGGSSPSGCSSIASRAHGAISSTSANRPSSSVWDGKPDVYHALQATLIPRVPLAPSLAASLRAAGT